MSNNMNALQQYIDLYTEHRQAVEANSPAALNAHRPAALAALTDARLPRKGQDDYEATDLEAVFAPDYGVNLGRVDFDINTTEVFHCDVPNLSTCLYFNYNDMFHASTTVRPQAGGVVVESLRQAALNHPDVLQKYYATVADVAEPTVALNTLLAQDGVLVYVPDGVTAPRPIQLVNIISTNMPLMAVRRVLVVMGENAKAQLLVCDHSQSASSQCLTLQVVEVVAGAGSTLDYYDMEESNASTHRVSTIAVRQERDSNVLVDGITLLNGMTRNNYIVDVDGEHATTQLLGMTIASGSQHVDTHTLIRHNAPRCNSNEMFKYVLGDTAVGAFSGKILVNPDCPRVEAYQGNRNICASPEAKMYTKPQLEIYTDDVKCSHGTTIGQLDEDAMFYMQARGISRETARTMLMQAFMSDVVDAVRLDILRDRLHHLVEKRFAGSLATCADCITACKRK